MFLVKEKWKKMRETVFSSLSVLLLSVFHVVEWLARLWLWWSPLVFRQLGVLKALGLLSTERLAERE